MSSATSSARTQAALNANAQVQATGTVGVRADGVNLARSEGVGFKVDAAGFGLLNSVATASGSEKAGIGAGAQVTAGQVEVLAGGVDHADARNQATKDRKSTRLNSSHSR